MKFVVFAVASLTCMAAGAAHAQNAAAPAPSLVGPPTPGAPAAAPAAAGRSCLLVTKAGDQYAESPLAGFDPAVTAWALPAVTDPNAVMVVCNRTTVIPEVTDYRVLTELRLPLSIQAGAKTLFLGAAGGKLQAGMPDGQATPEDTQAVKDRLDEMNAAMVKAKAQAQAKPQAKK